MSIKAPRVRADGDDDDKDPRIKIGFKIAPVPLNLSDKDRDLGGARQLPGKCRGRLTQIRHGGNYEKDTCPIFSAHRIFFARLRPDPD